MTDLYPYCDMRDKVFAIEKEMKKLPQLDLKVKHYFSNGVYGRELEIPKDTVLVGKIHKYNNLNILVKGCLDVFVDGEIKRIYAPFTVVSPPGTKRIARAIEDSIWITIHGTDETDINKIENHFIAQTEDEWLEFCKNEPQLSLDYKLPQRPDWPEIEMS